MRRVLIFPSVLAIALAIAAPAAATTVRPAEDDVVVISGDTLVEATDVVRSVVVFHGETVVEGRVRRAVVSFDGPVTISGTVRGEVVVFNGRLTVEDGALITGDVYADDPVIDDGAAIEGNRYGLYRLSTGFAWTGIVIAIGVWLAIAVSVLALGLLMLWLAPRGTEAALLAARRSLPASIGWGFAAFFGLPVLSVAAMATLVGIPFGIGTLLALALIFAIGQTMCAWLLGRTIVRTGGRVRAFLAGWAILAGVSLIPGVGVILWFATTVFGLGTIVVATWRARRPPAEQVMPAIPAMPPAAAQG